MLKVIFVTIFSLFLMLGGLANASDAVTYKNSELFARAEKMLGDVDAHSDTELDALISDLESLRGDEQYIAESFLAYASLRKKYSLSDKDIFRYTESAAKKGHAISQNNLAYCLEHGIGCEKNEEEAVKWYRKAAEQGFAPAQYSLGHILRHGIGCEKNEEEAVEWYRKAADQGYASGQNSLGFCLQHGVGCEKNENEAFKWYRKAADQGDAWGQTNLGFFLQYGIVGCERDEEEAVKWFRKAADQGHAWGQNSLGYCFRFGIGCKKNLLEAGCWYYKYYKGDFESTSKKLEPSINGLQDKKAIEMFYYALRYCYDKSDFLENVTFHHTTLLERKVLELTCDVYGYRGDATTGEISEVDLARQEMAMNKSKNCLISLLCRLENYHFSIERTMPFKSETSPEYFAGALCPSDEIYHTIHAMHQAMQRKIKNILCNPDCFMPCDIKCDDTETLIKTRLFLPGSKTEVLSFFKLGQHLYMTKGAGNTELCDNLLDMFHDSKGVLKSIIGKSKKEAPIIGDLRNQLVSIRQEFEKLVYQSRFVKQSQVVDIGGDDNSNI